MNDVYNKGLIQIFTRNQSIKKPCLLTFITLKHAGMTGGHDCWCSGVVSPATPLADTSCSADCTDDPTGEKRKCGGSGNTVSIWKLEEEYCPFKSMLITEIILFLLFNVLMYDLLPVSSQLCSKFRSTCFKLFPLLCKLPKQKTIVGDDSLVTNMYIGCYHDQSINDMSLRDFDQYINQNTENLWKDMTVPRCLGACATLGYEYGALSVSASIYNVNLKRIGKCVNR